MAAIFYMQHLEHLVSSSSDTLSVQPENLPPAVNRFFNEWKEQKKDIDRMSARLVDLEIQTLVPESINGVAVVIKRIDLPAKELSALGASVAENGGVALIAGVGDTVRVVLTSGKNCG